jgi:hypothetical protein
MRLQWNALKSHAVPVFAEGHFAFLAMSLAAVLTETRGWEICAFCSTIFHIKKHHTAAGDFANCGNDTCRRKADNRSKQKRRAAVRSKSVSAT